jgi:pimeloyl-ACP methyl ester carboxylesterase
MMVPEPYLVEPPLYLDFLRGSSDLLVIAFSGVGDRDKPVPMPEATVLTSWDGVNHVLFVRDASRSWMNAPGLMDRLKAEVAGLVDRLRPSRIVAFGNSMGGTAALLFATQFRVDAVLAIVPQYSMKPDIVPQERRWRHFARAITDWPYPAVPDLTGLSDTMILHGGDAWEMIHARRFDAGPNVDHYVFPNYGHTLAKILKNKQILRPLMTQVLNGNMSEARSVVEAAGALRFAAHRKNLRHARRERKNVAAV